MRIKCLFSENIPSVPDTTPDQVRDCRGRRLTVADPSPSWKVGDPPIHNRSDYLTCFIHDAFKYFFKVFCIIPNPSLIPPIHFHVHTVGGHHRANLLTLPFFVFLKKRAIKPAVLCHHIIAGPPSPQPYIGNDLCLFIAFVTSVCSVMCTYGYAFLCVSTFVFLSAFVCFRLYVRICPCVCTSVRVCSCVCSWACANVYVCICVSILFLFILVYTYSFWQSLKILITSDVPKKA